MRPLAVQEGCDPRQVRARLHDGWWGDETVIGSGFQFALVTARSVASYMGPRVGIDAAGIALAV